MDIVTRQNLVKQAATNDSRDALSLCQVDKRYRYACSQLPNETKFKVCLDNNDDARECDKVPMYSRDQFLRLIPPQIEIFPDEPLQLRHEFYSQNYKLKTEGFAEALRKAKIINTIVALSRPNILLQAADKLPSLPAYIDARQLDELLSFYKGAADDNPYIDPQYNELNITIMARSSTTPGLEIIINFWLYWQLSHVTLDLSIKSDAINLDRLTRIDDQFISKILRVGSYRRVNGETMLIYKKFDGSSTAPNAFIFSRIIYDLLNKGFDNWSVQYSFRLNQSPLINI